jgi:hypothetical protein
MYTDNTCHAERIIGIGPNLVVGLWASEIVVDKSSVKHAPVRVRTEVDRCK